MRRDRRPAVTGEGGERCDGGLSSDRARVQGLIEQAGPVRGDSAEFANLEGVDVLLEGNSFASVHGPHVGHLHKGRLSGALVLPAVGPEHHNCVALGDELLGHDREAFADFPESHEHPFEDRLRTNVRASDWKSVGFGPPDVVGHGAEGRGYVAPCEARVGVFDDFLVGGHLVSSLVGTCGRTTTVVHSLEFSCRREATPARLLGVPFLVVDGFDVRPHLEGQPPVRGRQCWLG